MTRRGNTPITHKQKHFDTLSLEMDECFCSVKEKKSTSFFGFFPDAVDVTIASVLPDVFILMRRVIVGLLRTVNTAKKIHTSPGERKNSETNTKPEKEFQKCLSFPQTSRKKSLFLLCICLEGQTPNRAHPTRGQEACTSVLFIKIIAYASISTGQLYSFTSPTLSL